MVLTEEQQDVLDELRETGWAVHLVSPERLDGTPRDWVENAMKAAATQEIGWDFFEGEQE